MKKIGILDYQVGNLKSIRNAMDYCGLHHIISSDVRELGTCDRLMIPGVGAFGTGIENLHKLGLTDFLKKQGTAEVPILGICLGFQLMCRSSTEFGFHEGLGFFPTSVKQLEAPILPNVGWSSLDPMSASLSTSLYQGILNKRFYFVHTFAVEINEEVKSDCTVTSYYDAKFASSLRRKNLFGVQFHPEKSSEQGLQLLKNFYEY
jgi:glutamine amidotransferase